MLPKSMSERSGPARGVVHVCSSSPSFNVLSVNWLSSDSTRISVDFCLLSWDSEELLEQLEDSKCISVLESLLR